MARITTIRGFGDFVNAAMEQLLRVAVLETDSRLKSASPVDTGRFRASWQVGENKADSPGKPPGNYPDAPQIERINYDQERLGNVYSVHNNLPYGIYLADGSSKQAEPGWVEGIAKDIQGFVQRTADQIARGS